MLEAPRAQTRQSDAELFERFYRDRNPADREAIAERHLPLARSLSRKYRATGESEDLEQVASLGLLKAIDRFDPSRGIAFSSFAVPTILGELKRYFRDFGWSVRVPRSLQELNKRLDRATDELIGRLGRFPTPSELAEHCDVSAEQVVEARALGSAHRADSLDEPVAGDSDRIARVQTLADQESGYTTVEQRTDLGRLVDRLPSREHEILRLRFELDLTQREIAERTGLSQMHVSRLIRAAITQLARHAETG